MVGQGGFGRGYDRAFLMSTRKSTVWVAGIASLSLAPVALLLGTCTGCGTRGYEERLNETVKQLGKESAFSRMYPPVQLPGTPVMVQLPRFLGESPLPEGSDPRRLKPPSIDLPDLKSTYEGFIVDTAEGKQHFYCYLAATKKDPERQLQQQFQAALPDTVAEWQPADCETPDGGSVRWRRVEGTSKEQEFYYVEKEGRESFRKMPAKMLLYLRQEGDLFLLIGWRLPSSIENLIGVQGDFGLKRWASRVAGSVTVRQ
jgi:hypothetical protein